VAAADRVDMQVEPLPASCRSELGDHLLIGSPPCSGVVAFHPLDQLAASLEADLQARLVMQVTADAREVQGGRAPDGAQLAGGSDTGPEQERGAAVRAGGQHHARRADFR
jgi:hypothetical protein